MFFFGSFGACVDFGFVAVLCPEPARDRLTAEPETRPKLLPRLRPMLRKRLEYALLAPFCAVCACAFSIGLLAVTTAMCRNMPKVVILRSEGIVGETGRRLVSAIVIRLRLRIWWKTLAMVARLELRMRRWSVAAVVVRLGRGGKVENAAGKI